MNPLPVNPLLDLIAKSEAAAQAAFTTGSTSHNYAFAVREAFDALHATLRGVAAEMDKLRHELAKVPAPAAKGGGK